MTEIPVCSRSFEIVLSGNVASDRQCVVETERLGPVHVAREALLVEIGILWQVTRSDRVKPGLLARLRTRVLSEEGLAKVGGWWEEIRRSGLRPRASGGEGAASTR